MQSDAKCQSAPVPMERAMRSAIEATSRPPSENTMREGWERCLIR